MLEGMKYVLTTNVIMTATLVTKPSMTALEASALPNFSFKISVAKNIPE